MSQPVVIDNKKSVLNIKCFSSCDITCKNFGPYKTLGLTQRRNQRLNLIEHLIQYNSIFRLQISYFQTDLKLCGLHSEPFPSYLAFFKISECCRSLISLCISDLGLDDVFEDDNEHCRGHQQRCIKHVKMQTYTL